jgi:hypothetical protein
VWSQGSHYWDLLLLLLLVWCFAMDTSCCERGFRLMTDLKGPIRNRMGLPLLQDLMYMCSDPVAQQWKADPSKIPVKEIIAQWQSDSAQGRFLNSIVWGDGALNGIKDFLDEGEGDDDGDSDAETLLLGPDDD